MGEILNDLIEKRNRLMQIKTQIQNYDIAALNAKITKINLIISKIQAGGWDP